jgi:hypothetical protein
MEIALVECETPLEVKSKLVFDLAGSLGLSSGDGQNVDNLLNGPYNARSRGEGDSTGTLPPTQWILGRKMTSSAIAFDGTVYVVNANGQLVAYRNP